MTRSTQTQEKIDVVHATSQALSTMDVTAKEVADTIVHQVLTVTTNPEDKPLDKPKTT